MRLLSCTLSITLIFASVLSHAAAQSTTNTNCTTNGNATNCTSTSTSTDNTNAYRAGQQVGNALGLGIARMMQSHSQTRWVKHYCAANPGGNWRQWSRADGHTIATGYCPTSEDRAVAAANEFMSKHKEYIAESSNSELLTSYIELHRLDPREEKSYEHAYTDLKKGGHLHLYAR
jgi:hypothetical protein